MTVQDLHYQLKAGEQRTFYRDVLEGGADDDFARGLEQSTVVLFAGHGKKGAWLLADNRWLSAAETRLGDLRARYFFLLSCQVMAHGPLSCNEQDLPHPELQCNGSAEEYGCPECRRASAERSNVFTTWADHVAPGLRMVCGASTTIDGREAPARFWRNHSLHQLPVADAFLLSLTEGAQVPLCFARGGRDPRSTGLFDAEFTTKRNRLWSRGKYLYALYPVRPSADSPPLIQELLELAAGEAGPTEREKPSATWMPPMLPVASVEIPAAIQDQLSHKSDEFGFRELQIQPEADPSAVGGTPTLRVNTLSGAITLSVKVPPGGDALPFGMPAASMEVLRNGLKLLKESAADDQGPLAARPVVSSVRLRLDRVAVRDASDPLKAECFRTCEYSQMQPWVAVSGMEIVDGVRREKTVEVPIFGEGAEWLIGYCPAGNSLEGGIAENCSPLGRGELFLSIIWRQPQQPAAATADATGKGVVEAEAAAWEQLSAADGSTVEQAKEKYLLELPDSHQIGYVAAPLHCRQDTMSPVHRFRFLLRPTDLHEDWHPVIIDVPVYGSLSEMTDGWSCSDS